MSDNSGTKVSIPIPFFHTILFSSLLQSKAEIIAERQANLPLPEDPPTASDWQSADATKVNVGSGGIQSDISYGGGSDSLRGPATGDSAMRTDGSRYGVHTVAGEDVGRQGHDNLEGLPNDAKKR